MEGGKYANYFALVRCCGDEAYGDFHRFFGLDNFGKLCGGRERLTRMTRIGTDQVREIRSSQFMKGVAGHEAAGGGTTGLCCFCQAVGR